MKRTILSLLLVLAVCPMVRAQPSAGLLYHAIDVLDDNGRAVTDINEVYIYYPGTTTAQAIYNDPRGLLAITQPMTTISTNTTLSNGRFTWYGQDSYHFRIGNDVVSVSNASTQAFNRNVGTIRWPWYLTRATSGLLADANDITLGDDADWSINAGAVDGRLTMIPAADGATFYIGNATYQSDFYWYAGASAYVLGDEGEADWTFVGVDAIVNDTSYLYLGSDKDFSLKFDNANGDLDMLGDDLEWALGVDGAGFDIYWHTETVSQNVFFDEDNSLVLFTHVDIKMDDDADLIFGGGNDFVIDSDTANTLDILPAAATDDYIVNFGLDESGVSFKAFGATTGEYVQWDAANDTFKTNSGNVLFTGTDAEANQFKVDATGTVAGNAIVLETTNGGLQIDVDGAANGDIDIDADSTIAIDAADDITIKVTSGEAGEDLILQQVGANDSSIIITAAGTGADAVSLSATAGTVKIAGDQLDVDSTNDINITVTSSTDGEDLLLTQVGANDSSITLAAAGTGADAIGLQASAGGIDVDAADDITVNAVDDLTLNGGSAGSVINLGTNTHGNVIHIGDNDTTADAITIGSAKDTVAIAGISMTIGSTGTTSATVIQSGTGDLALTSTDDITLTVNTAVTDNITITNTPGTAADAIRIVATAGGIDVDGGSGGDITITSTGKSVVVTATEEAADAIKLDASTGAGGITVVAGTAGIAITNGGAIKIGDGGSTNYSNFAASTGLLTFAGSARPTKTKYIPAQMFTAIAGTPELTTEVGTNKAIGFGLDDTAEEAIATTFEVPHDWAAETDVTVQVFWATSDTTGTGVAVVWDVNSVPLASDEDMASATIIVDTATDTLISATAWDLNISQAITIAASTEWAAGDLVSFILFRDGDNAADDVTGDAVVFGVKLSYTSDEP